MTVIAIVLCSRPSTYKYTNLQILLLQSRESKYIRTSIAALAIEASPSSTTRLPFPLPRLVINHYFIYFWTLALLLSDFPDEGRKHLKRLPGKMCANYHLVDRPKKRDIRTRLLHVMRWRDGWSGTVPVLDPTQVNQSGVLER